MTTTRPRYEVTSVTGQKIQVLHAREKAFYEEARDRYAQDFAFSVHSDLRALDRLLLLETQMYRYQWQLAAGTDYDNVDLDAADQVALRRSVKDLGTQISELQNDLNLTLSKRSKDQESAQTYIQTLLRAAKEHGVRREKEVSKSIELTKELFALAGAYARANEHERRKLGFDSADDIINWVLEYMKPEFDAIDEKYRAEHHRFYIRDL